MPPSEPPPTASQRRVVVIPGDGIGPEVIDAARAVIDATGGGIEWLPAEVGSRAHERHGDALPPAVLDAIREAGVALKGPVATPAHAEYRSPNVQLRRELQLYAQVRPARSIGGTSGGREIDVIVIREPTEGLYRGIEFDRGTRAAAELRAWLDEHGEAVDVDSGFSISPLSAAAARRVFEFAFAYAERTGRRRITVAHKATVMRSTDGVFLEIGRSMAPEHPDVALDDVLVDRLALELVRHPGGLDVLVMQNLYGDIFSDLAAGLAGGLGYAAGANYGDAVAVFEPAHGVVEHRAGTDTANPIGAILSGALLLRHLGDDVPASRIEQAVDRVVASGPLQGTAATTRAVIRELERLS
jgi:isocitrate dehydrogenase (NAD+)